MIYRRGVSVIISPSLSSSRRRAQAASPPRTPSVAPRSIRTLPATVIAGRSLRIGGRSRSLRGTLEWPRVVSFSHAGFQPHSLRRVPAFPIVSANFSHPGRRTAGRHRASVVLSLSLAVEVPSAVPLSPQSESSPGSDRQTGHRR